MKYAIILSLVALTGCAQTSYGHRSGDNSAMANDRATCEYQAEAASPMGHLGATGVGAGIEQGMRIVRLTDMCMATKGYSRVRQ